MNICISCIYGFYCLTPPHLSILSSLNMILHLPHDKHPFIVYLRQISFTDTGYNINSWFKMSISGGVYQTQLCFFFFSYFIARFLGMDVFQPMSINSLEKQRKLASLFHILITFTLACFSCNFRKWYDICPLKC